MIAPGTTRLLTNHLGVEQGAETSLVVEATEPLPATAFRVRGPRPASWRPRASWSPCPRYPAGPAATTPACACRRCPDRDRSWSRWRCPGPASKRAAAGQPAAAVGPDLRRRAGPPAGDALARPLGQRRPAGAVLRRARRSGGRARRLPRRLGRRQQVPVASVVRQLHEPAAGAAGDLGGVALPRPAARRQRRWPPPPGAGRRGGARGGLPVPDAGSRRLLLHDGVRPLVQADRAAGDLQLQDPAGHQAGEGAGRATARAAAWPSPPWPGPRPPACRARSAPPTTWTGRASASPHLQQHNREYLDDGQENILDDYCALLAATELYAAGGEPAHREAAAERAQRLAGRVADGHGHRGYWRANGAGEGRPFFHAVEAGLAGGGAAALAGGGRRPATRTGARPSRRWNVRWRASWR